MEQDLQGGDLDSCGGGKQRAQSMQERVEGQIRSEHPAGAREGLRRHSGPGGEGLCVLRDLNAQRQLEQILLYGWEWSSCRVGAGWRGVESSARGTKESAVLSGE